MKELVYKAIDGKNPRKKEVSIEEHETKATTHIIKKWGCKCFIKSRFIAKNTDELDKWIKENQISSRKKQNCLIIRTVSLFTGDTKILYKVLGEFFIVNGLACYTIMYMNYLRMYMTTEE